MRLDAEKPRVNPRMYGKDGFHDPNGGGFANGMDYVDDVAAILRQGGMSASCDITMDPPIEEERMQDPNRSYTLYGELLVPVKKQIYSSTILDSKMTDKGRDFFTLREDKFFASYEDVSTDPFHTATIINNLPPQERTKTLITLRSLRNILGVESFHEVKGMLEDESSQEEASKRSYRLIGAMYGIKGTEEDISSVVDDFGETANAVIDVIRQEELSEFAHTIEMLYDVTSTHDPLKLLLMTFDNNYDPRVRFEAKRKIILMFLAANIDLREREIEVTRKQAKFDEFLTEYVFTKQARKGHVQSIYYLADFENENNECTSVRVLTSENNVNPTNKTYLDLETREEKVVTENQKLISATRRSFTHNGKEIPIKVKNPPKERVKKILKLIRKGVGNPAVAVDDDVRMMGIVDNYDDIPRFMAHLQASAIKAGSYMDFEGVEDTINGGDRTETLVGNASKNGGNSSVQMVKFHARFGLPGEKPMYFEGILHTNKSFMNYEFQEEIAHREFSSKRFFGEDDELATADLLFPYIHYGIEQKLVREQRISKIRDDIRKESTGTKTS